MMETFKLAKRTIIIFMGISRNRLHRTVINAAFWINRPTRFYANVNDANYRKDGIRENRRNNTGRNNSETFLHSKHDVKTLRHYNNFLSSLQLEEMSRDSVKSVCLADLTLLPTKAARINREQYFVDEIVQSWWLAIEPQLKNIPINDFVKLTYYGLYKVNLATNGALMDELGSEKILKLTNHVLNSLGVSPNNFKMLLIALNNFIRRMNETEKDDLMKKLNDAYLLYLSGCLEKNVDVTLLYLSDLVGVTLKLVQLGFTKPNEVVMMKIVASFVRLLDDRYMVYKKFAQLHTTERRIDLLDQMAEVFLQWNVNPNTYDCRFWTLWYDRIAKLYPQQLQATVTIINALILKHTLVVALKFDQENEFLKLQHFWFDDMPKVKRFINVEDVKTMINDVNNKYADFAEKFDVKITHKILDALERDSI